MTHGTEDPSICTKLISGNLRQEGSPSFCQIPQIEKLTGVRQEKLVYKHAQIR